jgi:2-polyprenyl-3-methyl-5-hydroxy-6-metoxy-1,4-benzoquinol methylase
MKNKTKVVTKYSKKYNLFLQNIKASFDTEKSDLIKKQVLNATQYSKEPVREKCKNCLTKIDHKKVFFSKKFSPEVSIDFFLCAKCGHLNGKYQDTENYSKNLYSGENAAYGATTYLKSTQSTADYNNRVKNVYLPKAQFFDSVTKLNKKKTKIFDMGCGAGYLLKSFEVLGFNNLMGSEIAPDLIQAAKSHIPNISISESSDKDVMKILDKFDGNVVCMIGVLEHLVYNTEVMNKIIKNKNIDYLFISVPRFSLSVFLELLSTDFFHRQLSSGHTHLYTEKSLEYFERKYSLKRLGEWFFGADMEDLKRLIFSRLDGFIPAKEYLEENFFSKRDVLQSAVDKTRFTSEVHIVFKINR